MACVGITKARIVAYGASSPGAQSTIDAVRAPPTPLARAGLRRDDRRGKTLRSQPLLQRQSRRAIGKAARAHPIGALAVGIGQTHGKALGLRCMHEALRIVALTEQPELHAPARRS